MENLENTGLPGESSPKTGPQAPEIEQLLCWIYIKTSFESLRNLFTRDQYSAPALVSICVKFD